MKMKAGLLILFLAVLQSGQLGCSRTVSSLSKEKAGWDYVEAAWGGAKAGPVEVEGDILKIPLLLHVHESTRADSSICIYDPAGKVRGKRIRVRLDRGICSNSAARLTVVEIPKPAAGEYEIVYDDFFARYPVIGKTVISD
ncbi:MAG: hypothetical protein QOH06_4239 [Acidobacteriota bacterium]|jgi:hypothetical protein|nr:hypothetical protein [Acidobacteriota bacterium]